MSSLLPTRYTRAELNEIAKQVGIIPAHYRNKELLRKEILRWAHQHPGESMPLPYSAQGVEQEVGENIERKEAASQEVEQLEQLIESPQLRGLLRSRGSPRLPRLPGSPRLSDTDSSDEGTALISPFGWRPYPLDEEKGICGYKQIREIGRGSYSTISLVSQQSHKFALKIVDTLTFDDQLLPELWIEATILSQAFHPNILHANDIFFHCDETFGSKLYYLLPVASHGNMLDWLETNPSIELRISVLKDLLSGVAFLHRHKIFHGDLKPANLLINHETLWIADFSLSQRLVGQRPPTYLVQTIYYRAPEVQSRNYSFSADIWSIGAIMWELFTYNLSNEENTEEFPLFYDDNLNDGTLIDIIHDRLKSGPVRLSHLPEGPTRTELERLMNGCLAIDKYKRFTIDRLLKSSLWNSDTIPAGEWLNEGPRMAPSEQKEIFTQLSTLLGRYKLPIPVLSLALDITQRVIGKSQKNYPIDIQERIAGAAFAIAVGLISGIAFLHIVQEEYLRETKVEELQEETANICKILKFRLWSDNFPIACQYLTLQRKIIALYIEEKLPEDLKQLYDKGDFQALCDDDILARLK